MTGDGRLVRAAWWVLVVTFVAGSALSLVLKRPLTKDDLVVLPFATWGLVGALVAARRPQNPMGWLFLSIGTLAGLAGLAAVVTSKAGASVPPLPWYVVLSAWYQNWFFFPTIALSSVFTLLLFPSGLPSPRWRPLVWAAVASVATLTTLAALDPRLTAAEMPTAPDNPFAVPSVPLLGPGSHSPLFSLAGLVFLACGAAAVVSVFLRYRRARGIERLQLRWFVFAVVVVVAAFAVVVLGDVVGLGSDNDIVVTVATNAALALVPLTCGLAVLRYHLYDIDRVVSRTTSYALVTGLLVTVYAGVVTLVPRLVPVSSALAVAVATLVAAATAQPALRRVQRVVDRRFNRARVDAERVVDEFGGRLREEVDVVAVRDDLVAAVGRTMQPATITLWVRP